MIFMVNHKSLIYPKIQTLPTLKFVISEDIGDVICIYDSYEESAEYVINFKS